MKNLIKILSVNIFALFVMISLLPSCGNSSKPIENKTITIDKNLGEKLVKTVWDDFKTKQFDSIEKMMADEFQSVHDFGANNKEGELEIIKGLNISDYTISDLQITQNGQVIIATYKVSVEETIKGERLTKDPATRMSIFIESDGKWKWIAHANLKSVPVQKEKPKEDSEK